jgi:excisionase family DNA binding protein
MRVRAFVESGQQKAGTSSPVEDDLHELLTVDEVACLFKVSKSWVYEHTRGRGGPRTERLPHVKIGKYVRFEVQAVRAYVEKKCRVV